MSLRIVPLSPDTLEEELAAFVHLLKEAVDRGASLGFFAPLAPEVARDYWRSLRGELLDGSRLLLAARASDGRVVGTGQLAMPQLPSSRHRAEVNKLIVHSRERGAGVGQSLMEALHAEALGRGRTLILLGTRLGGRPEGFYRRLGYRVAGVIPGYATDAAGRRYDSKTFYLDLAAPASGRRTQAPPPASLAALD